MDNNILSYYETELVAERQHFIISLKNTCDKFSKDLFDLILENENELSEFKYVDTKSDTKSDDITECVEEILPDLVKEFSKTINFII